jgi:hypothetical protein
LQAAFENGDWRLLKSLLGTRHRIPAEACSQTMVRIYARHISRIEALIEEYPSRDFLWQHYAWACAITKQGSAKALLERLLPSPGLERHWPREIAMGLLIGEERKNGDRDYLAEMLWANWPDIRLFARNPANSFPDLGMKTEAQKNGFLEILWRDSLEPLLESLIEANRVENAETVVMDISKLHVFGDFRRMAANLAKRSGRGDLHEKWMAMETLGKPSGPDMDDLEAWIGATCRIAPTIVLTSAVPYSTGGGRFNYGIGAMLAGVDRLSSAQGGQFFGTWYAQQKITYLLDFTQMNTMISKGKLVDWRLEVEPINPRFSELMRKREGWRKRSAYWALIDTDRTMLGSGPDLPAEKNILQAFERSKKEPPVKHLRRFASEHPGHMEAKEQLVLELKRMAELRAAETLNQRSKQAKSLSPKEDGLNKLAEILTEEEDATIWGEYAALYQQTLPLSMESAQLFFEDSPYGSLLFFSSRTMKGTAHALLPQVEMHLKRRPMDEFLWGQWAALSGLGEQRHFGDLKNTLALSPLDDPLDFPPAGPRRLISSRYIVTRNWQGIIDLHEWYWEARRDNVGPDMKTIESAELLATVAHPLLIAYLYLGKDDQAEAVVDVLRRVPLWKIYKPIAVDLAKECGKNALAKRWKKLK